MISVNDTLSPKYLKRWDRGQNSLSVFLSSPLIMFLYISFIWIKVTSDNNTSYSITKNSRTPRDLRRKKKGLIELKHVDFCFKFFCSVLFACLNSKKLALSPKGTINFTLIQRKKKHHLLPRCQLLQSQATNLKFILYSTLAFYFIFCYSHSH